MERTKIRLRLLLLVFGILALTLAGCSASKPTELSGTYQGSIGRNPYTVTFLAGHACRVISPSNGETFSGTYKIEGTTVVVDFGFDKEIYQIADDKTLDTSWQGTSVQLKKRAS
jgi:hypothetical protein